MTLLTIGTKEITKLALDAVHSCYSVSTVFLYLLAIFSTHKLADVGAYTFGYNQYLKPH
jgi:hypothetical protein